MADKPTRLVKPIKPIMATFWIFILAHHVEDASQRCL